MFLKLDVAAPDAPPPRRESARASQLAHSTSEVLPSPASRANMMGMSAYTRSRFGAGLAVAALLCVACESGRARKVDPNLPILEDRSVLSARAKQLQVLQDQFRAGSQSNYTAQRDALLAEEPRAAPWIARWLVSEAVADADRIIARGLVPERIASVDKFKNRPLFRARRELVRLGPTGRRAILVYLLRDRRGQLRELADLLLRAHPHVDAQRDLMKEFEEGNARSRRASVEVLGKLTPNAELEDFLDKALASPDWQLRGNAIRALAQIAKSKERDADKGASSAREELVERAWRIFREDSDEWVRSCAIRALGDVGAVDQVRPLIDTLESLILESRGKEIAAAIKSLRSLTGRAYGSSVARWRQWLDGSRTGSGARRGGGR